MICMFVHLAKYLIIIYFMNCRLKHLDKTSCRWRKNSRRMDELCIDWSSIPYVILIEIFNKLSCLDRICVMYVCKSWHEAVNSVEVWKSFDFSSEMIDAKIDLKELLNGDSDNCNASTTRGLLRHIFKQIIKTHGKHFESVCLNSEDAFSGEVLVSVCQECCNLRRLLLKNITSNKNKEMVCSLLQKNKKLQSLHLVSIKFDFVKNEPLPIGHRHSLTLQKLCLVNSFRTYNLGTLMYLVNLKELAVEPQFLSYSLLYHLAGHSLVDLYILAISKLTGFYNEAMQEWHWKEICKQGPNLRVHFRFSSSHDWTEKEILLKPYIPIKSLIYFKYRLVHFIPLRPVLLQYSSSLQVFIDFSIAMVSYEAARSDKDIVSMNKCLLDIVLKCQELHTFSVKEVLATSTLLAMVSLNNNLKNLYIMEDQILYENILDRTDVPEEIFDLIDENCTKESFTRKMSDIMGCMWRPLSSDDHFQVVAQLCDNFVEK